MIAGNKTTVNGSMNYYVQESPKFKTAMLCVCEKSV